jgi:dihydrodipicolinate synthase/N-acetylneuraminate lyase
MRDKPKDFLVISGDDPISLPMIAMGGVGVISVVGNALPKQFSDMIRKCLKGDFKGAHTAHLQYDRVYPPDVCRRQPGRCKIGTEKFRRLRRYPAFTAGTR